MIDAVVSRFGFARMPFGRDLPPSRLHRHHDCGEAAHVVTALGGRPVHGTAALAVQAWNVPA